jgi:hypothetical protein
VKTVLTDLPRVFREQAAGYPNPEIDGAQFLACANMLEAALAASGTEPTPGPNYERAREIARRYEMGVHGSIWFDPNEKAILAMDAALQAEGVPAITDTHSQ